MTIEQRLEVLESQNRLMRRALLLLAAVGMTVLLVGQAKQKPGVVTASEFLLKDPKGRTRVRLGIVETKKADTYLAELVFLQADGEIDASLMAGAGSADLTLGKHMEQRVGQLALFAGLGISYIRLAHDDLKTKVKISAEGAARVELQSDKVFPRLVLSPGEIEIRKNLRKVWYAPPK